MILLAALLTFATFPVAQAKPQWVVTESYRADLDGDKGDDEMKVILPRDHNDPGAYTRLQILFASGKKSEVRGLVGEKMKVCPSEMDERRYLCVFNNPQSGESMVLLQEYAFASSPGRLRAFRIVHKDAQVKEVFNMPFALNDIRIHKTIKLIGRRWYAACYGKSSQTCDYSPHFVYQWDNAKQRFVHDESESASYNEQNNYPWAGPDYLKTKLVKTERKIVEKSKIRK